MFKKLIHLADDFYYSPSHNTFLKSDSPDQVDFYKDRKLTISGREEIIFEYLLSKYNNGITVTKGELEEEFREIDRPYDKVLENLRSKKLGRELGLYKLIFKSNGKVVISLPESPFTLLENAARHLLPVLKRPSYVFNYGRILSDYAADNTDNPQSILFKWLEECKRASRYDQKCIIILESIGFLPAFGNKSEKREYLKNIKASIYNFDESDIKEYDGTELLLLTRSIIFAAIEYIEAQNEIITPETNTDNLGNTFEKMLQSFLSINVSDFMWVNPLLLVVYYHYLGLVYYRNYLYKGDKDLLIFAKDAIEKALQSAKKGDQGPEIWKAFLTYDLARVYCELGEYDMAIKNIQTAVKLRKELVEYDHFSDSVKRQLYFEYLLAKIIETDIKKKATSISENDAQTEYSKISNNANTITNMDSRNYIRRLLEAPNRMGNKGKER